MKYTTKMNEDKKNISAIETYLDSIFDESLSQHVFFGSVPNIEAIKTAGWNNLVCVEIPNGVEDKNAIALGTVLVWLFAKPMPSGRKNVPQLSKMEKALNAIIAKADNNTYRISRGLTYTYFDRDLKWDANVVELILKVT